MVLPAARWPSPMPIQTWRFWDRQRGTAAAFGAVSAALVADSLGVAEPPVVTARVVASPAVTTSAAAAAASRGLRILMEFPLPSPVLRSRARLRVFPPKAHGRA